jgi:dihydrolipoamide dehydrogenase
MFETAAHDFPALGISIGKPKLDMPAMMKHKDDTVAANVNGVGFLLKKNKVEAFFGHGAITAPGKVSVTADDGAVTVLETKNIVIATGSDVAQLPGVTVDEKTIVSSTGALLLEKVPAKMVVVGAGVIGLELGSVWRRLGSAVTVLEAMDAFLPMADEAVAKEAQKQFKKQGLDIRVGAKVSAAVVGPTGVAVTYDDAKGSHTVEFDRVVVAIGRRPYTDGLLADDTGVKLDARGFIEVDDECRTGVEGVYAVGDCVRGPMLAHKGKEEGVMVADLVAGRYGHVNYATIPSVIYTAPEMAWVGATEQQVKASGRAYKVGSFPFLASGRARAMEAAQGFAKVIAAVDDDSILGVHIIGPMAGELIAEAVLAMEYSATTEDLQRTIHAHPTLSEALHEAALAADKRAIDYPNR